MRHLFIFCLLFLFILTVSFGQTPIAHWKMDSNCELKDETNSPANGVLINVNGGVDEGRANLVFGDSLVSYAAVGVAGKMKISGDFSASFFIKAKQTNGTVIRFGNLIDIPVFSIPSLHLNQWQKVAVVFQLNYSQTQSVYEYYVDNVNVGQRLIPKQSHDYFNSIVKIGDGFLGSLFDLRLYDRILTEEEILTPVLPATLEYFNAKIRGAYATVAWRTSMEEGVSGFEIERSEDGVDFKKIGWKDAVGKPNNYVYDDFIPATETFTFYRLRTVDVDGVSDYSKIARVLLPGRLKIYPNPVVSVVHVPYMGKKNISDIKVFNSFGTVCYEGKDPRYPINLSHLQPGVYFLLIKESGIEKVSTFIKK